MDRGDQYDKGEQAEDYRPLHTLVESFSNIAVTTDRDVVIKLVSISSVPSEPDHHQHTRFLAL